MCWMLDLNIVRFFIREKINVVFLVWDCLFIMILLLVLNLVIFFILEFVIVKGFIIIKYFE